MGANTTGMNGQMGAQMGANGQQQGMVGQRNSRLAGTQQTGQTGANQNMTNRQGQNRNNTNRRTGQQGNQNGQNGAGSNTQNARAVRPQMVVAFNYASRAPEKTQLSLSTKFSKLANKEQFKGVEIQMDGSTVILRGEVATDKDIRLATSLARLEPGVRKVQNELTVPTADIPAPEIE
jgi:hypothetical protein